MVKMPALHFAPGKAVSVSSLQVTVRVSTTSMDAVGGTLVLVSMST